MSGDEAIQCAVDQMSLQPEHFLRKPNELSTLTKLPESARGNAEKLRSASQPLNGRLIGVSQGMVEVRRLIEKVARTDLPVYVEGESGTGKELVAVFTIGASPSWARP